MLLFETEIPPEVEACQKAFELSCIPAGIVTLEGRPLWFSTAFPALLGFSPEEFSGQTAAERIHPDDMPSFQKRLSGIAAAPSPGSVDRRYRHKDGRYLWLNVSSSTIRDSEDKPIYIVGIFQDVTDARTAELAVRESEARLQLVITAGNFGIWELDRSTRATFWNKAFREILGVSETYPASRENFEAQIHPEDRERAREEFYSLGVGARDEFSPFRILRPNGEERWLQGFAKLLRKDEHDLGKVVGAMTDITDARAKEQLIEAQRAKLFAAAKMSALGEMAGGLAHEINNPMAIIHGNALLLKQQASRGKIDRPQLEKSAETIEQTAERISKIIRSLRAFARNVEQDPFEPVSVRDVLAETAELCHERFRLRSIEFRTGAISESLQIEARPVQISQVLLNLLNNAYDAVESMPEPWIQVQVVEEPAHVQIRVINGGPAIPAPLREKVFQPFFTTKEIGKGTGLGLSVSTGIVETHSGTLDLDSTHAHTCFVVRLPKKQG